MEGAEVRDGEKDGEARGYVEDDAARRYSRR